MFYVLDYNLCAVRAHQTTHKSANPTQPNSTQSDPIRIRGLWVGWWVKSLDNPVDWVGWWIEYTQSALQPNPTQVFLFKCKKYPTHVM